MGIHPLTNQAAVQRLFFFFLHKTQTMIPQVLTYKGHIIHVKSPDEVITTNLFSKKWRVANSLRAAKWNISVWDRLSKEFQS